MLEVADLNLKMPDLRSGEIRLTLTPVLYCYKRNSSTTLPTQEASVMYVACTLLSHTTLQVCTWFVSASL